MGMTNFTPQHQEQQPGKRNEMKPQPQTRIPGYRPSNKLQGKTAIITGGDSGIGRAVALLFAQEGADIVITYLNEHEDAREAKEMIENENSRCLLLSGDIGEESFCKEILQSTIKQFGKLDILVNNAGEQHAYSDLREISSTQWDQTFRTDVYAMFYLTKEAISSMSQGGIIINTTSVTAYQGHKTLLDYSAAKGAIVSFTRSCALHLAPRGIRVNAVAPGPVWTPLIPASFSEEKVSRFGSGTALERAAQPYEIAPCYLFLATNDSSYMTGQVLHPNGGRIVNG